MGSPDKPLHASEEAPAARGFAPMAARGPLFFAPAEPRIPGQNCEPPYGYVYALNTAGERIAIAGTGDATGYGNTYGPLFAAAPDLYEALEAILKSRAVTSVLFFEDSSLWERATDALDTANPQRNSHAQP